MEGRVFVCSWKMVGKQYRVWVKNRPQVAATGTSLIEADEALWAAILEATGDGESLREYDPPLPADAAISGWLKPPLVAIQGANTVTHVPEDGLFKGKRCEACGWPRGPRTDKPLVLDDKYIESGVDGGIASIEHRRPGGTAGGALPSAYTWRNFFSEAFLALLTPEERDAFTWRKAERTGRGRKVYFELCEAKTTLSRVAVKGLPVMRQMQGWRCSACAFRSLPWYGGWGWPTVFVCGDDLPPEVPSCFGIGDQHDLALCMRAERWRKLVGKRGTNGLTSEHVPVVPSSRRNRRPALPVRPGESL